MKPIVEAGHVPTISPMGNLPDASATWSSTWRPFWQKIRAMKPWLDPGYDEVAEKERIVSAAADERDPQGGALHHVRLLRLGVQLDGVRPGVPRAGRARQGHPLRRRRPRPGRHRAAERLQPGARDLGLHAVLLLQRALPEGRRPARRDRQARRGVDQAEASTTTWARSTRSGSSRSAETTGWLRETELVPKTQGIARRDQGDRLRAEAREARGKVPPPFPPHVAEDVDEARALHDLVKQQGRDGAARDRPGRERRSAMSRAQCSRPTRSSARQE